MANEDPLTLLFTNKALKRHDGLTKAQSSLLAQARIGDIGLRDYLFRVKVPQVPTPYCARVGKQWSTWWCGAPTHRCRGRGSNGKFGHTGTYRPYSGGSLAIHGLFGRFWVG